MGVEEVVLFTRGLSDESPEYVQSVLGWLRYVSIHRPEVVALPASVAGRGESATQKLVSAGVLFAIDGTAEELCGSCDLGSVLGDVGAVEASFVLSLGRDVEFGVFVFAFLDGSEVSSAQIGTAHTVHRDKLLVARTAVALFTEMSDGHVVGIVADGLNRHEDVVLGVLRTVEDSEGRGLGGHVRA